MRTIEQIIDHCAHLNSENLDVPLILTIEEVRLLHRTYCPNINCDPEPGKPVGMFMGRYVWLKHDWLGHMLWIEKYSRTGTTVAEVTRPSSEPVRIGDTIKALLKDWRIDPIDS